MQRSVFYSWQSDLPNSTNREFIKNVLAGSLAEIESDDTYFMIPFADRGAVGSTALTGIAASIFTKINNSSVFVCDLSVINNPDACGIASPNPNVLLELGYAAKKLGWKNIIVLMNDVYGGCEKLSFDLSNCQLLTYTLAESSDDQTAERRKVSLKLKADIIETLVKLENRADKVQTVSVAKTKNSDLDATAKAELKELKLITSVVDQNAKACQCAQSYMELGRSDLSIKFAMQISSLTGRNGLLIKIAEFCIGSGEFASARKAIDDITYLAQRGELAIKVLAAMDLSD